MRVIKFRAWSESKQIMLPNVGFHPFICEFHLEDYKDDEPGAFTISPAFTNYHLMQFTGLLDRTGKEIYEGDIIKNPSEDYDYCICVWNEKNACFQIDGYGKNMYFNEGGGEEYSNDVTLIEEHVWVLGSDENIEVIGDIHTTPELLTNNNI